MSKYKNRSALYIGNVYYQALGKLVNLPSESLTKLFASDTMLSLLNIKNNYDAKSLYDAAKQIIDFSRLSKEEKTRKLEHFTSLLMKAVLSKMSKDPSFIPANESRLLAENFPAYKETIFEVRDIKESPKPNTLNNAATLFSSASTMKPKDIPEDISCAICPIMGKLMRDPVIAEDGHNYEREAIVQWLEVYGTSPLRGDVLNKSVIMPDGRLKELIDKYCQDRPDVKQYYDNNPAVSKKVSDKLAKAPSNSPR